MLRICCRLLTSCGLVVQLVVQQIHSKWNVYLSLSFAGLDVPQAPMATSTYHQQPYGDRLAQTRGDLKLLEQLVSQTFHLQPQQLSTLVYDDFTDQQQLTFVFCLLFYCCCAAVLIIRITDLARLFVCQSCKDGLLGNKNT